jgi:hypothetical protein
VTYYLGLTNITVDGGLDDHVVVPQDGIDALHKAANTDPSHVHASASVPSYKKNPPFRPITKTLESSRTNLADANRKGWRRE